MDAMTRSTTFAPVRQHVTLPETAGAVAHFAGWEIDLPACTVWWSAHAFAIFELPPGPAPTVEQLFEFCTQEYRARLRRLFEGKSVV